MQINLNDTRSTGPLTAEDLDAYRKGHTRRAWPSCSGPCEQGKKLCPCPDDCQIAPQRRKTDPGYIGWGAMLPAALVLVAVGVLALARWVFA